MCCGGNCGCSNEPLEIKIKYFSNKISPIVLVEGKKSDWYDLRAAEKVELKAGEFAKIKLGVDMILPVGYEAHLAPRSSTYANWYILQTNSVAVIDNSYSGDDDEWMMPVYAVKDTTINVNDRICQFRIIKKQPEAVFTVVDKLNDTSRGGFGTTGKQ